MRALSVFLFSAAALAQSVPEIAIQAGVPLRVALEHRVRIKHAGDRIAGRLVEPLYVYDREVLPAGTVVEGQVAEIGGVPFGRRLAALLNGNFTPPRNVRAQFDALLLNGSRIPLQTSLTRGAPHTAQVMQPGKKRLENRIPIPAAILAFKEPGKWNRLKSRLFAMLPYHRQAWPAGTLFNAALQQPLAIPSATPLPPKPLPASEPGELTARLLAPLSSATARRGAPVEAAVTKPVFSADHKLLIPEGSRLEGEVVRAQRARWFHRNGKLLFIFREVKLPPGGVQKIQGDLEGIEADFDAHLVLDEEGATHVASPKTRFIFPAIATAAAGLSFHQDYNSQGVPDRDSGGRAESGAVGFGLVGTLVAQLGPRALASGIAVAGAAFSIYTELIARGANVVLPANTPLKVNLAARGGTGDGRTVK